MLLNLLILFIKFLLGNSNQIPEVFSKLQMYYDLAHDDKCVDSVPLRDIAYFLGNSDIENQIKDQDELHLSDL